MNMLATWAGKVSGSRYPSGQGRKSGGTTFSSKEALATYARQHPKADMSKHTVAASAPKAAAPAATPAARPGATPAAPAAAPAARPAAAPAAAPLTGTSAEARTAAHKAARTADTASYQANSGAIPHADAAAAHEKAHAARATALAHAKEELRGMEHTSYGPGLSHDVKQHEVAMNRHAKAAETHRAEHARDVASGWRAETPAAASTAPTAPIPATGSTEHARRNEVAKSAATRGAAAEKSAKTADGAGKPGLAALNYLKAAQNHLDLHPSHGSLETQLGAAKSAVAKGESLMSQVTDASSRGRLRVHLNDAKSAVANMEKFAAMKPEQREAEVVKRNMASRFMRR